MKRFARYTDALQEFQIFYNDYIAAQTDLLTHEVVGVLAVLRRVGQRCAKVLEQEGNSRERT